MSVQAKPIDVELMCSLLEYAPELGGSCLRWKVDMSTRVKAGMRAGYLHKNGYWRICLGDRTYLAHRLVWVVFHKEDPVFQVDHIFGIGVGNTIENLRLAKNSEKDNGQNRKRSVNNTSGYTGIHQCPKSNKWIVRIQANGKRFFIGAFDSFDEAIKAHRQAKIKLHTFNPTTREEK